MRIRSTARDVPAVVVGASYPVVMDDSDETGAAADDLLSTLEVIEDQPLGTRAAAYESLHDTLARRLEAGPAGALRP